MTRKLSLALSLAAALLPAAASARAVPESRPHCSGCLTSVVAGGANAYRRLPGVRATPLTPVKTGGVEASRRNVQVKPVAGAGTAVANPSMPCNGDCNHRHA